VEFSTMTLAERFRWIRKEILGITQAELAEELDVSIEFISAMERGVKPIPKEKAQKIAELTAKKAEAARQEVKKNGRRFTAEEIAKHPHIRAAFLLVEEDCYPTELEKSIPAFSNALGRVFQPFGFFLEYASLLGFQVEPHEETTQEYPDGFYELKKDDRVIRASYAEVMALSDRIARYAKMEILHLTGEF